MSEKRSAAIISRIVDHPSATYKATAMKSLRFWTVTVGDKKNKELVLVFSKSRNSI